MSAATGFHGPRCWAVSAAAGALAGLALTLVLPAGSTIPLMLVAPFAALLLSIAVMPFISVKFWHDHFPDFAFFLGAIVVAYYLRAMGAPGRVALLHSAAEYYGFIALVGGLYIVSGGILIDVRGKASPLTNTLMLLAGAVLANIVGTTGASVLLIRPFMRMNRGRLRPIHIVFFIFIISNCAGCLTPIGDPPLYIGYLKGVPFLWTLEHLWRDWAFVVGVLLAIFFGIDTIIERRGTARGIVHIDPVEPQLHREHGGAPITVRGAAGVGFLGLMIVGVFIDPALKQYPALHDWPVGATFQVIVAALAYQLTPREIHEGNEFTFFPVKEVGLLFLGIFATMVPALGYLAAHGAQLGVTTPTAFYFGTGGLSAVLDNAPTYLNFMQVAFGATPVDAASIAAFLAAPGGATTLSAISGGAVFFGAMTYIGNGPNFMVRSVAESMAMKMPSFFGYFGWACLFLLPVLVAHWFLFIR